MRSDPQLGRAPADLIEALDAVAKGLGWSRTYFVIQILRADERVRGYLATVQMEEIAAHGKSRKAPARKGRRRTS